MDLSTNTIFRHILAQEGYAHIIKAIKHDRARRHALKVIKHAKKQDKAKIYYGKQ